MELRINCKFRFNPPQNQLSEKNKAGYTAIQLRAVGQEQLTMKQGRIHSQKVVIGGGQGQEYWQAGAVCG